jgi:uncharacterized protein (TIGR00730 family)
MERICVFCGSSPGSTPVYLESARKLGQTLAGEGLTAVFGGGSVGLMGALADATMEAGGKVIGVIPEQLIARELDHAHLTELRVVKSMHERKALMAELSDGFIALPGGAGTLEEFSEIWTWQQLGIHKKPCGLLNVRGYYDRYLGFLDHMVAEGFLRQGYRDMVLVEEDPARLLGRFRKFHAPEVPAWLGREET